MRRPNLAITALEPAVNAVQYTTAALAGLALLTAGGHPLVDQMVLFGGRVVDLAVTIIVQTVATLFGRIDRVITAGELTAFAKQMPAATDPHRRGRTARLDPFVWHVISARRGGVYEAVAVVVGPVADLKLGQCAQADDRRHHVRWVVVAVGTIGGARADVRTDLARAFVGAAGLGRRLPVRRQAQRVAVVDQTIAVVVDAIAQLLGERMHVGPRVVAVLGHNKAVPVEICAVETGWVAPVAVLVDAIVAAFGRTRVALGIVVVAVLVDRKPIRVIVARQTGCIQSVAVLIHTVTASLGRARVHAGVGVVAVFGVRAGQKPIAVQVPGLTHIDAIAVVVDAVTRHLAGPGKHARMSVVAIAMRLIRRVDPPTIRIGICAGVGALPVPSVTVLVDPIERPIGLARTHGRIVVVAIHVDRGSVSVRVHVGSARHVAAQAILIEAVVALGVAVSPLQRPEWMGLGRIAMLGIGRVDHSLGHRVVAVPQGAVASPRNVSAAGINYVVTA